MVSTGIFLYMHMPEWSSLYNCTSLDTDGKCVQTQSQRSRVYLKLMYCTEHELVIQTHVGIFCPSSQFVSQMILSTSVLPPDTPPLRGPARCWRRRCPGASRLHLGSAPLGHDTRPKHTSSSSPSPDLPPQYLLWGCGSP